MQSTTPARTGAATIVARAIDFEMKKRGLDCVYLISATRAKPSGGHFPNIHARCLNWASILPANRFRSCRPPTTCGGIVSDQRGRPMSEGLYVAGEASCTGLRGANRLASNSLLECLVYAEAAVERHFVAKIHASRPCRRGTSRVTDARRGSGDFHNWDELRRFMWDYVGIVRTNKRLKRARHRIQLLKREIDEFYANFRVNHDLIELRNLVVTADLIVRCAMQRRESRGLHFSVITLSCHRDCAIPSSKAVVHALTLSRQRRKTTQAAKILCRQACRPDDNGSG